MRDLANKVILVVGATGALGSVIAKELQDCGAEVLGTARSAESSARLSSSLPQRLLMNLEDENSIAALTSYLRQSLRQLDGVVLAAGVVAFGGITETPTSIVETLLKVNFKSQASLIRELLPLLHVSAKDGNSPFVLSLSGVIAETPMSGLAAYSASKTALYGYATAAAKELRKQGITWLDARPGHTETGLASRAIFGEAPNFGTGLTTEFVAERIVSAILNDEKDLPSSSFKA